MRGNSNDIHGIIIDNKEYKINRYADDTQLFLNESENSLNNNRYLTKFLYNLRAKDKC